MAYPSGTQNSLDMLPRPLAVLVVIGCVFLVVYYKLWPIYERYQAKRVVSGLSGPILLGYLLRADTMTSLASGTTPGGLPYNFILGMGGIVGVDDTASIGLYTVELPFRAEAHIIGVARAISDPLHIAASRSSLAPLKLEGDYDQYFTLYVDESDQVDGRYVMDPGAMQFTIDFCRQYHWEIFESSLYFMSRTQVPSFDVLDEFVASIRPAIVLPDR